MKRFINISFLLLSAFFFMSAQAQEKWDLNKCINYAKENNLYVQKQLLQLDYDKLQIKQVKDSYLPGFSATFGNRLYFGRTLDQSTNQYNNYNSNETSLNLGGSISLFEGFRRKRDKEMMLLNFKSSEYSLEQINNDISLSIATSYLDVLQRKDLIKVLVEQLSVTKEDGRRVKIRYDAGDVSKDVYLEIKAQIAREESQLIEAKTNHTNALLILAQILDVKDLSNFDVVVPELPLIESKVSLVTASEIFENALSLPNIKVAELQIENDKVGIERAKSGYYPTASVFANYSNFYNNKAQTYDATLDPARNPGLDPSSDPFEDISFGDQITENPREVVGLNIDIPIFSRFQNKNAVKAAQIKMENASLDLEIEKKNLREKIQTAYSNAKSSYAQFLSAEEALNATKEANRFASEKYNVGAISPFDYNTSKGQLIRAEAELLQAKYNFIFATKVLEFYNGIPLAF